MSVKDASANTAAASHGLDVSSSSATTRTGTSRIRRTVRALGTLSVNTRLPNLPVDRRRGTGRADAGADDQRDRHELAGAEVLVEDQEPRQRGERRLEAH